MTGISSKLYEFYPQLPTNVKNGRELDRLLVDPRWSMSQKIDGERCVLKCTGGGAYGFNRSGEGRPIEKKIMQEVRKAPGGFGFDGEVVDDTFFVFDLIEMGGHSILNFPFEKRYALLYKLLTQNDYGMVLVGQAFSEKNKKESFERLRGQNYEGVIFKDLLAPYKQGRAKTSLKWKFVKQVDCHVTGEHVDGKSNFVLTVYRNGEAQEVGKVSALTGDGPKVKIGDVVTVDCLYSTPSGKIVQPTKPRIRTDKQPEECTYSQILDIETNSNYDR